MSALGAATLRNLLDSPLPCIAIGPDGQVSEVNAAAAHLAPVATWDQAAAGIAGMPLGELLGAADAGAGAMLPIAGTHHGVAASAFVQPLRLADGGALLILSALAAFEVAEQKRFEETPYGVVRLDLQGVIRFANASAQALWSDRSAFVGEMFVDFFSIPAAGLIRARLQEMLATETACTVRIPDGFQITDGERVFRSQPELTLVPYFAPGGRMSGVVVHIHERIVEALRLALRDAADGLSAGEEEAADWRDRMRAVLDLLQSVVPHDRAVFSLLSDDRLSARPLLVHPPANPPWPPAWAPVPGIERERMAQGPFTAELPTLLQRDPELGDNQLVALHAADQMVSHAVLPVPHGRPKALLTLASKCPEYFKDDDGGSEWPDNVWPQSPFRTLMSLGLDSLLISMLRRVERQEEASLRAMAQRIGCARTVPEATHALLEALVEQFQWDHAAVFAVEPGADGGQFRLFAQFPEKQGKGRAHPLALPVGYTQPLYAPPAGTPLDLTLARKSGMMGAAVRARTTLVATDTRCRDERGDAPHFFRSPAQEHGSALTVPIELDGRTRWVLDTVSRYQNAFHVEDGARVGPLVRRLARQVAIRRSAWLNEMLIERIEQGVVVTDAIGHLLRANARAREMLGLPQSGGLPEGRRLSDHAADAHTHSFLAGTAPAGSVRLGPIGGLGSEVRVRRCQDTTETRDLVWLLDGSDEQDWTYDRTYIEATVQEVARQVRGPLLLASSLAGRIARTASDAASPALERVRAEIGKADITFERLAESIGARRDPRRHNEYVDVAALLQEIAEGLPERDRNRLETWPAEAGFVVQGDRERLRFVLRTLLGHMLACNPDKVEVGLTPVDAGPEARLCMVLAASDSLSMEATGPSTPLEDAARAAREAATLALDTVADVLRAHGGRVRRNGGGFALDLPLSEVSAGS